MNLHAYHTCQTLASFAYNAYSRLAQSPRPPLLAPTPPTEYRRQHETPATPDQRYFQITGQHTFFAFGSSARRLPKASAPQSGMDGQGVGGGVGGHSHGSATSPVSVRSAGGSVGKRKRSGAEFESSPGSGGEHDEEEHERRRQPGVKRACNECRQQKVSHKSRRLVHFQCASCLLVHNELETYRSTL